MNLLTFALAAGTLAQTPAGPAPLLATYVDGMYGFIDRTGKVVVEPIYEYASFMI